MAITSIRVVGSLRNPTMGLREGETLHLTFTTDDATPIDPATLDGTYKIENVQENFMDLVEQQ